VGPRRERPLTGPPGVRVHQAVKDLEPVVAHPELVGVRERQAQLPANLPVVLDDAIQLAADVLGGRPDAWQDPEDRFFQRGIEHSAISDDRPDPIRLTARTPGGKATTRRT